MDIRSFTATGIMQQTISNQVQNTNTTSLQAAQNSQKPRTEHSILDPLQPATLKGPDSATRPTAATGRPAGDHRTAEEIKKANPTLQNLEMRQSIYRGGPESRPLPEAYKQGIYKHTGDWTDANKDPQSRADAAYNAARLFNFIDSNDAHAVLASQHNDGFLSGFSGNEKVVPFENTFPDGYYPPVRDPSIREDSEHALLTNFIEHGYSALEFKGEQQIYTRPTHATGRPRGDQRSAEDISKDNPILHAAFTTINSFVESGRKLQDFQKHTGDWSKNNKDPQARADATYNLAYIANYIDNLNNPTKEIAKKTPTFNASNVWGNNDISSKHYLLQATLEEGYKSLPPPTSQNKTS